jgi:hypothetical protein
MSEFGGGADVQQIPLLALGDDHCTSGFGQNTSFTQMQVNVR